MESDTLHNNKISIENNVRDLMITDNKIVEEQEEQNNKHSQSYQHEGTENSTDMKETDAGKASVYNSSDEPPLKKTKLESLESNIVLSNIDATSDVTRPAVSLHDNNPVAEISSHKQQQTETDISNHIDDLKSIPSSIKMEDTEQAEQQAEQEEQQDEQHGEKYDEQQNVQQGSQKGDELDDHASTTSQFSSSRKTEEVDNDIERSIFSHIGSSNAAMDAVKSFLQPPAITKPLQITTPNEHQELPLAKNVIHVNNGAEVLNTTPGNSSILAHKQIKKRLLILYDQPRYTHMKLHVHNLKNLKDETLTIIELNTLKDQDIKIESFDYLNLLIEYNDEFEANIKKIIDFIEEKANLIDKISEIGYHLHFDPQKKWQTDYKDFEKEEYKRFLEVLNKVAGSKVTQCSIINKYEINTIYLTEKNDLAKLGQEIQEDIIHWLNLRIFDYGENCIRFLPGVKFSDSLEVLNIGGGYSLETLAGFKMPLKLKTLIACNSSLTSIDNVNFPASLETLQLHENRIYFLNYVDFPSNLVYLDVSNNRIDTLRGVNFPRSLKVLSLSSNPIECIKGAKFPDLLEHLDLSCIPNESMTGVKFPDTLISLNLQESMTNTRGLKLPPAIKVINLVDNGVNSINPLKLPNSIEKLYLNCNNIKTLNKVQFPISLKELYLGNNLITTLKNVQFPAGLEILDLEMDPDLDENDKHITTLKDVVFPPNLKVLKLGYHSIKSVESVDFPYNLEYLSLAYNELKIVRNIRFGLNLKVLDLSGNQDLTSIDHILIPDSVIDLRIPIQLLNNLPAYIVDRANKGQLTITKSAH